MSAYTPFELDPDDKLDALRYLDEFHCWYSLDDQRFCRCCGRRITGRQIAVIELPATRGKLQLRCPTTGCLSTPSEWVELAPSRGKTLQNVNPLSR